MTTLQKIEEHLENLTDEEAKKVLQAVESILDKRHADDFLKKGDRYFSVLFDGDMSGEMVNDERGMDMRKFNFGNAYKAIKQAEIASKHMRKFNRILRFAIMNGGFREFEYGINNYYVFWVEQSKEWNLESDILLTSPTEVYMTRECAELLCKKLNSGDYKL